MSAFFGSFRASVLAVSLLVAFGSGLVAGCADISSGGAVGTPADGGGDTKKSDSSDGSTSTCAGVSCDDSDPCTDDFCDDASKTCKHVNNAVCKDGNTTEGIKNDTEDTGPPPNGPNVAVGELFLTEILYNPYGGGKVGDSAGEWFEIFNNTDKDLDLGGLVVHDLGKDKFVVAAGNVAKAKSFFVFGIKADTAVNGGVAVNYAYGSAMTLNNTFDAIILESNGLQIDAVNYDITKGWLNVNGVSLSLSPTGSDASSNDSPANWCGATTKLSDGDAGTPGMPNDACQLDGDKDGIPDGVDNCPNLANPGQLDSNSNGIGDACESASQTCGDGKLDSGEGCDDGGQISGDGCSGFCQPEPPVSAGSLIISEFMANPAAVGDDVGEWVELFNPTTADITINGVVLAVGVTTVVSNVVESPGPVIVPAGGFLVLGSNNDVSVNGGVKVDQVLKKLSLANTTSTLSLRSLSTVIDTVSYGAKWPLVSGKSASLDPSMETVEANDVPANWCKGQSPYASGGDLGTPGSANASCAGADQDEDQDGIPDGKDNCPSDKNVDQADGDSDGVGDVCDNCKAVSNADQADGNKNGVGDLCEAKGCGNGVLESGEGCDDGNLLPGDGCGVTCQVEADLAVGTLLISEVMANPKVTSDGSGEWIEIYNASGADVELAGLTLSVASSTHTIKSATPLPLKAGAFALLSRSGDSAQNGGLTPTYVYGTSLSMPNSTPFTVSIAFNKKAVDSVNFTPGSGGFPALGNGASYQLSTSAFDVLANDSGANWCLGTTVYGSGDLGSPGTGNQLCGGPVDSDKDGVADAIDNCPLAANVSQTDTDGDAIGDACDKCPSQSAPGTVDGCVTLCGNATIDTGEGCDDGNHKSGDGCSSTCTIEPPEPMLVITEIMNDSSSGSSDNGEWLEVYNPGSAAVDLIGWTLLYKTVSHPILGKNGNTVVQAGSYLVLGRSSDTSKNGGTPVDYVYGTSFAMSNTDGSLSLKRPDGTIADSVSYASKSPWPGAQVGASLQLSSSDLDVILNDSGASWCTSKTPYGTARFGTPGKANATCAVPPPPPGSGNSSNSGGFWFYDASVPAGISGLDRSGVGMWKIWINWFGGGFSFSL